MEDIFKEIVWPQIIKISWKSPKRLKILKWLKKRGYEVPYSIYRDSQKAYDLKIFRWLQKTLSQEKFNISTSNFEKNMLGSTISEEKLRWLVDNGIKTRDSEWHLPVLESLQAILYLGEGDYEISEEASQDPRLSERQNK
jgi:hypothetical protein